MTTSSSIQPKPPQISIRSARSLASERYSLGVATAPAPFPKSLEIGRARVHACHKSRVRRTHPLCRRPECSAKRGTTELPFSSRHRQIPQQMPYCLSRAKRVEDRTKCCQAPSPLQNPSTTLKPNHIKNPETCHLSYGALGILKVVSRKQRKARLTAGLSLRLADTFTPKMPSHVGSSCFYARSASRTVRSGPDFPDTSGLLPIPGPQPTPVASGH